MIEQPANTIERAYNNGFRAAKRRGLSDAQATQAGQERMRRALGFMAKQTILNWRMNYAKATGKVFRRWWWR